MPSPTSDVDHKSTVPTWHNIVVTFALLIEPAADDPPVTPLHGLLEMALQLRWQVHARVHGVEQRCMFDTRDEHPGERMDRRLACVLERDVLLALPNAPFPVELDLRRRSERLHQFIG